ncbi:MAG: DUF72 domain-containing protein [Rhizomicrobium sp.]|jgi:uncharacterized protein YecE (DUF72 family)
MIRVGIGGWSFAPWRSGVFYPKGLALARELGFASRAMTTIEINATYHRTQTPASFRKWAAETPDDFVFAMKASRFATNRKALREAAPSIKQFLSSGIAELGGKLGPILWQFAPTKKFDAADFEDFLVLLPPRLDGIKLRHAIEVRNDTFKTAEFVSLARKHGAGVVVAHSDKYPLIADVTADFVYARLQCSRSKIATGYTTADIKAWAGRAKAWGGGKPPKDLPLLATAPEPANVRDVFVYIIGGAKERAPAAAVALLDELK